jgi:hypothetical protein
MSKRTDIHRPAALVASDYEYVAPEYLKIQGLGDAQYLQHCRAVVNAHMARTGGAWSRHTHGGNCMVCGNAQALYTIVFYHAGTNSYVRMGTNCAEQVDSLRFNRNEVACMRRAVKDARQRKAGKEKARTLLADAGLERVWDMVEQYRANDETSRPLFTMTDIVDKMVKYGNVSEAQLNYLRKLVDQTDRAGDVAAERAAEREAAKPAPTGRVMVQGTVVSVDRREHDWGTRMVMTVKTEDGWLAWGTVPSALLGGTDSLRGARVRFKATMEPSDKDPKFAFFSRPSSATFLEQEAA